MLPFLVVGKCVGYLIVEVHETSCGEIDRRVVPALEPILKFILSRTISRKWVVIFGIEVDGLVVILRTFPGFDLRFRWEFRLWRWRGLWGGLLDTGG